MIVGIFCQNSESQTLWAKALGTLVAQAGHTPKIGYIKKSIPGFMGTPNWAHLSQEADLVIFACDSQTLPSLLNTAALQPYNQVLVSPGLELTSGQWVSDFISIRSSALRIGVLTGPKSPQDILKGLPTAFVVASEYDSVNQLAQTALHSSQCRLYSSRDRVGVELAGTMTHLFSIALGLVDQLQKGSSARGVIIARALAEASRLNDALKGDQNSLMGLAGVGSIVASGNDNPLYQLIKSQKQIPDHILHELNAILHMAETHKVAMPLTQSIVKILKKELNPLLAMDALMRREATAE